MDTRKMYGLVRLNVAGRVREFSIWKVLGAKLRNIADNVTRPYIIMLTISLVVLATVATQIRKVAVSNPVNGLKVE
ncbi:MAG: hypothetical protein J0H74_10715 [Chitinophagaceae bacterium]|nr:hypothetical protein [Chitinophagaceae bacterium]